MPEYRLSWEMQIPGSPDPTSWFPTDRVADDTTDILDQHSTLVEWERTGEEPIRNIKLEKREPGDWEATP